MSNVITCNAWKNPRRDEMKRRPLGSILFVVGCTAGPRCGFSLNRNPRPAGQPTADAHSPYNLPLLHTTTTPSTSSLLDPAPHRRPLLCPTVRRENPWHAVATSQNRLLQPFVAATDLLRRRPPGHAAGQLRDSAPTPSMDAF